MLIEVSWTVRSAPAMLGFGTGLAILMSAYKYTGGRLSGYIADPDVDEVSRKEAMRKNRRRPIEQTVNELGEGRGAYTWQILNSAKEDPATKRRLRKSAKLILRRCIRSRIRAAESGAHQGAIRHRRPSPVRYLIDEKKAGARTRFGLSAVHIILTIPDSLPFRRIHCPFSYKIPLGMLIRPGESSNMLDDAFTWCGSAFLPSSVP